MVPLSEVLWEKRNSTGNRAAVGKEIPQREVGTVLSVDVDNKTAHVLFPVCTCSVWLHSMAARPMTSEGGLHSLFF